MDEMRVALRHQWCRMELNVAIMELDALLWSGWAARRAYRRDWTQTDERLRITLVWQGVPRPPEVERFPGVLARQALQQAGNSAQLFTRAQTHQAQRWLQSALFNPEYYRRIEA